MEGRILIGKIAIWRAPQGTMPLLASPMLVFVNNLLVRAHPQIVSATIIIAPHGHSFSHNPQPLQ